MNDEHIYNLIMSEKQEGLSMLLDKYGGLIAYIARNIGSFNDEDLAECISDILLAVWERIDNYRKDKSSFKSWFVLVARGCIIDYIRKTSKHSELVHLEDIKETFVFNETYDTPSIDKINELISMLSPPDNEIFCRHFILGEDISHISKELNMTSGSIYKRISRGRDKLKAILIKEGYHV